MLKPCLPNIVPFSANCLCYTFNDMEYKYAGERLNYADLASGHVFFSLPGHPPFPVRLASEIYQRCLAWRGRASSPCTLYDPCCGAAYHLSVIAYLHWDSICRVICSDIDEKAVQMAERNLGLLTPLGMERRSREIAAMVHLYDKDSHKGALGSITRMQEQMNQLTAIRPLQTDVFQANATDAASLQEGLQGVSIDIVFTDIPYGQHSQWEQVQSPDPAWAMLEALHGFLSPQSIVAVASDKAQKIAHQKYIRLEKLQIGKRRVVILKLAQ
jgi:23S rRNA (guanine2535-N1)-methyltransferase